jgi:hypothetical protein
MLLKIQVTKADVIKANHPKSQADPITIAILKVRPDMQLINLPWKATERLYQWSLTSKMSPFEFEIPDYLPMPEIQKLIEGA